MGISLKMSHCSCKCLLTLQKNSPPTSLAPATTNNRLQQFFVGVVGLVSAKVYDLRLQIALRFFEIIPNNVNTINRDWDEADSSKNLK